AQCDLLQPQDLQSLDVCLRETQAALEAQADDTTLAQRADDLSNIAGQCLKPYPHAVARDNFETLLVVIALAMSIRTFFFQPFRIPTGSMQPTLYGITVTDLRYDQNFVLPGFFQRARAMLADGV